MWRSFWRSIDRFSLQYFKHLINELREIKVVDKLNRELVVDVLQSIVEIVTYGGRHDPSIFECFMEYQVLAEFVRLLKISRNSRIEAPLLQYLSIMIQNMESEHAIYYCFSNDYINSIILHQFEFNVGDLALYYVSFLRVLSSRINKDTIWLLVKVHKDVVVSFPLYSEALKFAHHGEKMIQTAIRALTLNIYNVSDDMIYQFLTTPPASQYFSDLIQSLKRKCFHLDALVHASEETYTHERRKNLLMETDRIADDLYYLKDILSVGKSCLSRLITQALLRSLVFPILLPLLELNHSTATELSAVSSLYVVCRLLQIVDEKNLVNPVARVVVYPCIASDVRSASELETSDNICQPHSYQEGMNEMGYLELESEGAENVEWDFLHGHLSEKGILPNLFSEDHSLLLAPLMLLMVFTECKDLDSLVASVIGSFQKESGMRKMTVLSSSHIVHALLKILASQPPFSVLVQWHTGWFLHKLLAFQQKKFSDDDIHLFNTSYEQSCKHLWKELDGCWFEHIPDTLKKEWGIFETTLEDSPKSKDPFFLLELASHKEVSDGEMTSSLAWKRMVDAVKVFILHHHLKSVLFDGNPLENSLISSGCSSMAISATTHASDLSCATLGSELPLASGSPCKIAFSNTRIRDIYLMPVATEIFGKLLLVEEHPYRIRQGVVIAAAPLAALCPKIDESQPTWLHLQVREFDPPFDPSKAGSSHSGMPKAAADGRWTLGFPNAEACKAARLLLLQEISKQRSRVETLLASLL